MDISGASSSSVSSTLEIKSLQLAKSQQKIEGQATLELLEAATAPKTSSANSAIGSNLNGGVIFLKDEAVNQVAFCRAGHLFL
jgi:hypothetical protein